MNFLKKLNQTIKKNNSLLCIGLDTDISKIPKRFLTMSDPVFAFNKWLIDQTYNLVCAYKPDTAFYEADGIEGLKSLKKTIEYIPKDIPIILDAKRGSVGHTAEMYAKSVFDYWKADAVTLHIFTGKDGVEPFLAYKSKYSFLYIRSSNPSASDFQDIDVNGKPFYQVMARKISEWKGDNFGIIAPATYPKELGILRKIFKDRFFLVPGIGAQGGNLEKTLKAGLTKEKSGLTPKNSGLIISSSRSIIYSNNPKKKAQELQEAINRCRNEK